MGEADKERICGPGTDDRPTVMCNMLVSLALKTLAGKKWCTELQPATGCCYCSGARKNGTASLHQHLCGVTRSPPHLCSLANYISRAASVSKDSPVSLGDNVWLFSQPFLEPSLQKEAESSPKVSSGEKHKSEGTDGLSLTQPAVCTGGSLRLLWPFPEKSVLFQSPLTRVFLPSSSRIPFLYHWDFLVPTTSCLQMAGTQPHHRDLLWLGWGIQVPALEVHAGAI